MARIRLTAGMTEAPSRQADSRRPSVISILRDHRDYRLLWFGTLATQGGQWVLQVALGWLMLVLTDSEFYVGLIGFAGGLPLLLFSVPSGVLVDRRDRRAILLVCQAALVALSFTLAMLVVFDLARPWHLLVAAFANGLLMTVNNTTRQTVVVATVPREQLASAIAFTSAGQNATRIVGPSLAGVIIGLSGVAGAFFFQAAILLVALAVTFPLTVAGDSTRAAANVSGGGLDGFGYVWNRPLLRDLTILAAIPALIVFPYVQLLPVFARDVLEIGPQGLGILMGSTGLGAVIGALVIASLGEMRHKGWFMTATLAAYGLFVLAFALSPWVWLAAPMLVMAGVTSSASLSLNNSLLHLNVTDDVRGRVMGVYMLTWGLMPIGALPMGVFASWIGAPATVAAFAGLSSLVIVLLALRSVALREL